MCSLDLAVAVVTRALLKPTLPIIRYGDGSAPESSSKKEEQKTKQKLPSILKGNYNRIHCRDSNNSFSSADCFVHMLK